jgi:transcriptional regulator with XRE-family HTH domain
MRLTIERLRRGWSKAELARRARFNQGDLSRVESGRLRPYAGQLARIAAALEWPADRADELLQDDVGHEDAGKAACVT